MMGKMVRVNKRRLGPQEDETMAKAAKKFLFVRDEARDAVIEECAKAAEAEKQNFLSSEYASNQPFGSICERFACDEVAKAIRALKSVNADDLCHKGE
jgi:hypothetical protein